MTARSFIFPEDTLLSAVRTIRTPATFRIMELGDTEDRTMFITTSTTVKSILEERPDAVEVFLKHGVDVPSECDECILDTELELCDSMCHIDDLDGLITDLQALFDSN